MQSENSSFSQVFTKVGYWLNEVVFWGLVVQALWATYQSIKIIFINLPTGEAQLAAGTAGQAELNLLVNDAILSVISSIISILVATWFGRRRSQGNQMWETALGVVAVLFNLWLNQYLQNQSSAQLIEPLIETIL